MAAHRVLRRKDAPHIFYGWNPVLAQASEMEEAWIDPKTQKYLEDEVAEAVMNPGSDEKPSRRAKAKAANADLGTSDDG